jgi:hypothetical protein
MRGLRAVGAERDQMVQRIVAGKPPVDAIVTASSARPSLSSETVP